MTPVVEHLGFVSLEPWDDVWRRNQHVAHQLVAQELVGRLTFVEPPTARGGPSREPEPGIRTVTPRLPVPRRAGGLRVVGAMLRLGPLRDADFLWVNDAALGRWTLRQGVPALHDVTDDWRTTDNVERVRRRIVAAEDALARRASTVACSPELAARWHERYGVDATLVPNGIDVASWEDPRPVSLPGPGPHVGYVGTLHAERLDIGLLCRLAAEAGVGSVHLVGPDALDDQSRARLDAAGVVRHGPVPAAEVPGWTTALDVLVCPHVVTPFTLSLDAIKAREYLASGRPVVATPTSGFQHLGALVVLADAAALPRAVVAALGTAVPRTAAGADLGWDARARDVAALLATLSAC